MDDTLLGLVLERLDRNKVGDDIANVLLAAFDGEANLSRVLDGAVLARPDRPSLTGGEAEPAGAYLTGVTVTGFRGVGPPATIPLAPGPGLTLVVGRNGSGKSSFADGLEILLTGGLRRWDDRTAVWREGWRNLHYPGPAGVRAELVLDDVGRAVVERHWADGAGLDGGEATVQVGGEKRAPLDRLGWARDLLAYRPFLSHAELEAFLGRPSELHDLLASVLGLEDLTVTADRLAEARKPREAALSTAKKDVAALQLQLAGIDDERASACTAALGGKTWDLDTVLSVATSSSPPSDDSELAWLRRLSQLAVPARSAVMEAAVALRAAADGLNAVAHTEAASSRDLAGLLEAALAHHAGHGDGDCPVCGRRDALDQGWRRRTEEAVAALNTQAATADHAALVARTSASEARSLLGTAPEAVTTSPRSGIDPGPVAAAWSIWSSPPENDSPDGLRALADHLEDTWTPLADGVTRLTAAAATALTGREDLWAPLAGALAAWSIRAAEAQTAARCTPVLKKAETWLKAAANDIRNARLAPLADQARAIWAQLRQESNVELGAITLSGTRTRRDVDLNVTVDGSPGAALGVMSQGEINALALSIFLPRATMPASPFRFLMIDDPVQAMDPAKVDGLARVLDGIARRRQVIVFTHDNRLPEAVRRLAITSTILEVTRRPDSVVEVRTALDPVSRALEDAVALCSDDDLPRDVAARVVPALCRVALEASLVEVGRRRQLHAGANYGDLDVQIEQANTLTKKAAFAFFADQSKGGDVLTRLNAWGRRAGDTYLALNKAAHGPPPAGRWDLLTDTRWLVERIQTARW